MNDVDYIERNVKDLEYDLNDAKLELQRLEQKIEQSPYFLVGLKGCVRTYIAIFENYEQLTIFIKSCELKNRRFMNYRKNSPLYGYDGFLIERTFIPNNIPFNPTLEYFKKGK